MTQDPNELRGDIEARRAELGETVGALAQRADVSARAREQGAQLREQAKQTADQVSNSARRQPTKTGAIAAAAVLVVGTLVMTLSKGRKAGKRTKGRPRWT